MYKLTGTADTSTVPGLLPLGSMPKEREKKENKFETKKLQ